MEDWQPASFALDASGSNIGRAPGPTDELSAHATLSVVFGLVSIFGLFVPLMLLGTVLGLVFGIRSLRSAKRSVAVVGIVLSCVGALIDVGLAYIAVDLVRHVGVSAIAHALLPR